MDPNNNRSRFQGAISAWKVIIIMFKLRGSFSRNTQFFEEKPKLSFYHRKMHQSFFFHTIYTYGFSQNGQILTDLLRKLESAITFFEKLSRCFFKYFTFGKTVCLLASVLNKALSVLTINSLRTLKSSLKKVDFET